MTTIPAFTRLPRVDRLPRGFAAACYDNNFSATRIAAHVRDFEICILDAELTRPAAKGARATAPWLSTFLANLGIRVTLAELVEPAYLVFRDVHEHSDGPQHHKDAASRFAAEEYFFLNIQLAGAGCLHIDGKVHRIEKGDAYVFDQRIPHQWVPETTGHARAFSVALPEPELLRLIARLP